MVNITLEGHEKELLIMSLQHCLETCRQGGKTSGCSDCEKVEKLLNKVMK